MATRRSHVVRIYDDTSGSDDKDTYIDVEVIDAISFKIGRGEEVILDLAAKKCVPYIVDDTGHGLEQTPSAAKATRRTHVEHIKGENDTELLVEVLDAIAFRDKRGEEWILKMPSKESAHYNVTKGSGASGATMRTHNEKIGSDPKDHDPEDNYLTVERSDMISFKSVRGKEMIIKMPSRDDGKDPGRADTRLWSPENYDPENDDIEPPKNEDPNFYVKFVKGKTPLTGDELIAQGPLWWIRKVTGGNWLVCVIKAVRVNHDEDYKLNGYENFEEGGHNPDTDKDLEKFPFNADKGAGWKSSQIDKDHKEWRGNINDSNRRTFTALYFHDLDKETNLEIPIEFPVIGKVNSGTDIGYYVWPDDNNDPTKPYLPQPDKEQALEPLTGIYADYYHIGEVQGWIAVFNADNSWYESWSPGLRAQMGSVIGYAAFDALVPPDGQRYGWTRREDRDAFLAAWNTYVGPSQSAPGAYESFWPLPPYHAFEIDWTVSQGPPSHPTSDYEINVYRITGRNNMVFDATNTLQFKLPTELGKDHRQQAIHINEDTKDKQKVKVKWTKEDGITISVELVPVAAVS